MGMKPPVNEPFGMIGNAVNQPAKKGHYDPVGNTINNIAATSGDPNPTNAGACTTVKGPVPTA